MFPLFAQLPYELRAKIWECSTPGPRIVHVSYSQTCSWQPLNSWFSPDPVPAILHACRESREEGLKHYQLAFANYTTPGRIYFDYSRDTLAFGGREAAIVPEMYFLEIYLSGDHGVTDADKIRFLQFDLDDQLYDRASFCWDEIRLLPGLEKLAIICWEETAHDEEDAISYCAARLRDVKRSHPEWKAPQSTLYSKHTGASLWVYTEDSDQRP